MIIFMHHSYKIVHGSLFIVHRMYTTLYQCISAYFQLPIFPVSIPFTFPCLPLEQAFYVSFSLFLLF